MNQFNETKNEELDEDIYLGDEPLLDDEDNNEAVDTDEEPMPTSLIDFLCENPVEGQTEKVTISERLKAFEFEIGEMSKKQYDTYVNQCMIKDKKGKLLKQNIPLFNELVVINHCLYPDFKSVEFVQKAGSQTSATALYKVLKLGEVEKLAECILTFNGFDRDFEALRKKAKN